MSQPLNVSRAWQILERVREVSPLIHGVTNQVVMNFTANVLYAVGASPLMSHAPEEAAELAATRANLLVNIGTLTTPWLEDVRSILRAEMELKRSRPRAVLDPVGAGFTRFRTDAARELLATGAFGVLRGNAFEVMKLAGESARGQGVDSGESSLDAAGAARRLAAEYQMVVAVSGVVDFVTDGRREIWLRTGHPLLTRVTGTGCALNAVIAATTAVDDDPLHATAAALAAFGAAAMRAAESPPEEPGPGQFAVGFLDALTGLKQADLEKSWHVEHHPVAPHDSAGAAR